MKSDSVAINLIDGWMHPLGERIAYVDNEPVVNMWFAASMIVGGATKRFSDADQRTCIETLLVFGVIERETAAAELLWASRRDVHYLELLNRLKECLVEKANEVFEGND